MQDRRSRFREFEIQGSPNSVLLVASFEVSLAARNALEHTFTQVPHEIPVEELPVEPRPAIKSEVLSIRQTFTVGGRGTDLSADRIGAFAGPHPLLDTKTAANVNGVALVQIRTDFVDLTEIWSNFAGNIGKYKAEHSPGTTLVVLGKTTGGTRLGSPPLIWFASIPDAC